MCCSHVHIYYIVSEFTGIPYLADQCESHRASSQLFDKQEVA